MDFICLNIEMIGVARLPMVFQALSANLPHYTTVRIPFPGCSRVALRHQIGVLRRATKKNVRDRYRIIGAFRRQVADMKIQEMRSVPSPPWPQPRWNACSGPPEVAFFIDRLTPLEARCALFTLRSFVATG
jgi:hypothetical protein